MTKTARNNTKSTAGSGGPRSEPADDLREYLSIMDPPATELPPTNPRPPAARSKASPRAVPQLETTTAAPVSNAGDMSDALLKISNEIKALVVDADRHDVAARYKIAVPCREVRDGSQYRTGDVEKLAKFLHWHASTVYDYAQVATVWTDEQEFGRSVKGRGKCLSWSHIVELTREKDANRRQSLITGALSGGWSVERLAKEHGGSPVEEADSSSPATEPTHAVTAATEDALAKLAVLKRTWEDDLPQKITNAEPDELDAAFEKVSQVRRDFDTFYQAGVRAIDLCLVQIEERRKLETSKELADQQRA